MTTSPYLERRFFQWKGEDKYELFKSSPVEPSYPMPGIIRVPVSESKRIFRYQEDAVSSNQTGISLSRIIRT